MTTGSPKIRSCISSPTCGARASRCRCSSWTPGPQQLSVQTFVARLLQDCGSTNGTYVNGARVTSELEVRPDDELVLGDVRFFLRAPAPQPSRT